MVGKTEASLHPVRPEHLCNGDVLRLLYVLCNEIGVRAGIASEVRDAALSVAAGIRATQLSTDHSGDVLLICRAIIPERANV